MAQATKYLAGPGGGLNAAPRCGHNDDAVLFGGKEIPGVSRVACAGLAIV